MKTYFAPWIVFQSSCFKDWQRDKLTFKQLYDQTEKLRIAAKKALGYTWDNTHFHVADGWGMVALQIQFDQEGISVWDVAGRDMPYIEKLDDKTIKFYRNALDKIHEGYMHCNQCGKWVKKGRHYGYCGFACNKCYDPKVHLPPDSR